MQTAAVNLTLGKLLGELSVIIVLRQDQMGSIVDFHQDIVYFSAGFQMHQMSGSCAELYSEPSDILALDAVTYFESKSIHNDQEDPTKGIRNPIFQSFRQVRADIAVRKRSSIPKTPQLGFNYSPQLHHLNLDSSVARIQSEAYR